MARFSLSNVILFVVATVFCRLTMGSAGKSNSSPIISFKMNDNHNVTSVILQHGQSYKAECRQSNASTKFPDRNSFRARHRREEPSDDGSSEYTVDSDALDKMEDASAGRKQTVHLLAAKYVPAGRPTQSCSALDVANKLRTNCTDFSHEVCLFVASDPSTVSGCQRRSLQLEYYCGEAEAVGGMQMNAMVLDIGQMMNE